MTMTYAKSGNPTPVEEERVKELLRRRNDKLATTREVVELALLLFSPLYQEDNAVSVLRELRASDPGDELASLWLSYICAYSEWRFGPASLDEAIDILDRFASTDAVWVAAAGIIRYGALSRRDRGFSQEKTACLERSIQLKPEWIHNHTFLAGEYVKAARYAEALEQIDWVRKNQTLDPPVVADLISDRFERLITGRLSRSTGELILRSEAEIFRKRPDLARS